MSYTYSLSGDFSSGLSSHQLQAEIGDEAGIIPAIQRIDTDGDAVYIVFASSLSAGEKTTLDGLVASHIPDPVKEPIFLERIEGTDTIQAQLSSRIGYFPALYTNTIHISQDPASGQYLTIKAAIEANPIPNTIFLVQPGTYVEDNPITLPMSSYLLGAGTTAQVTVVASNPSSDLIIMNAWSKLDSMIITGASGTGARGIYFDGSILGTGVYALFEECIVTDCNVLIEANNGPDTLLGYRSLIGASSTGDSPSKGIYVHNGGQFTASSISVAGSQTPYVPIVDGIICEDPGSKISLSTSNVYLCTRGVSQDNDGEMELNLLTARGNVTTMYIGSTGTNCKMRANSFSML